MKAEQSLLLLSPGGKIIFKPIRISTSVALPAAPDSTRTSCGRLSGKIIVQPAGPVLEARGTTFPTKDMILSDLSRWSQLTFKW